MLQSIPCRIVLYEFARMSVQVPQSVLRVTVYIAVADFAVTKIDFLQRFFLFL